LLVPEAIPVDLASYGSRAPGWLDRLALTLTRSMPDNWLGLRLAILFRRIVTSRLGRNPLDTELWGMRLRLYALGNGCEKNALFTPQMFDVMERGVLADAIARRPAEPFTLVDIGANVGLYSLFVASRTKQARILAIEPQPGILDRLRFNLAANPDVAVTVLPIALADRDGTIELLLDTSDSGGTHINKQTDRGMAARPNAVSVPCRTLAGVIAEAGMTKVDALKIDVEGAEDLVLMPFFRDAPPQLWPEVILIEDTRGLWQTDVFALLEQCGYTVAARSRQNAAYRRAPNSRKV
jgi:FkbM family methyltransferase